MKEIDFGCIWKGKKRRIIFGLLPHRSSVKLKTAASCIYQNCSEYTRDWRSSKLQKNLGSCSWRPNNFTFWLYYQTSWSSESHPVVRLKTQQQRTGPLRIQCCVAQLCRTTMSVQSKCYSVFFLFYLEIHWKLVPSQTRAGPFVIWAQGDTLLLLLLLRHLFRGNRYVIDFSFKYLNHLQVDIESCFHLRSVKPFSPPLALPLVHLTILFKT